MHREAWQRHSCDVAANLALGKPPPPFTEEVKRQSLCGRSQGSQEDQSSGNGGAASAAAKPRKHPSMGSLFQQLLKRKVDSKDQPATAEEQIRLLELKNEGTRLQLQAHHQRWTPTA